jgi:Transposase IS116/IS110/IS902 family
MAIAAARLNGDRVDARTLAHLLRADLLPRHGSRHPWCATNAPCCATAPAWCGFAHHPQKPASTPCWPTVASASSSRCGPRRGGPGWTGWRCRPPPAPSSTTAWGLVDQLAPTIARVERGLLARATSDPRVQALLALPGIGRLTAMTLVAEIGDIGRFATARKLCAWAGLTPAVRNLRPQGPPRPHPPSRAPRGCAGCWSRPPTRPPAGRLSVDRPGASRRLILRRPCRPQRRSSSRTLHLMAVDGVGSMPCAPLGRESCVKTGTARRRPGSSSVMDFVT